MADCGPSETVQTVVPLAAVGITAVSLWLTQRSMHGASAETAKKKQRSEKLETLVTLIIEGHNYVHRYSYLYMNKQAKDITSEEAEYARKTTLSKIRALQILEFPELEKDILVIGAVLEQINSFVRRNYDDILTDAFLEQYAKLRNAYHAAGNVALKKCRQLKEAD
jgi:uncharacterized protein YnzC (UPF0291/DUF896 family)